MSDRNLDALPAGLVLDGYRIERELGSGGFGITYLATEIESGRRVAIKEYMPKAFARRDAGDMSVRPVDAQARPHFEWGLERFRDEARSLIRLHHPNIVMTLRLFSSHGTAYIVMNYVDGESLAQVLARAGTLSPAMIDAILPALLEGLAAVHAAGYLHRDLKPANIYIRRADGQPILLDFGAAREALGRETQTLSAIVTPRYSPPEQYGSGAKQKETADVYALAATLYRCVAGEAPPEAPDRVSALVMGRQDPILPAETAARGRYPVALLRAIDSALSIREDDRPQTVAAFRALLRGAAPAPPTLPAAGAQSATSLETLVAGATAERAPAPQAAPPRRLPMTVFGGLALAALAGAGAVYFAMSPADRSTGSVESRKSAVAPGPPKIAQPAPAAARAPRRPGETYSDCPACPQMVVVPAGTFKMGSSNAEAAGLADALPQHDVVFAKPFAVGRYEVTFDEYEACVADGGCKTRPDDAGWGKGTRPVINVSWQDAMRYAAWLARRTGKRYRLPSEAEWEYVARAGSTTPYPWGSDLGTGHANCDGCGSQWDIRQTAPVGSFAPNRFGLFDVIGNAAEWVADCWSDNYIGAPLDGTARPSPGVCTYRLTRGGSWYSNSLQARAAFRLRSDAGAASERTGFRVASDIE